MLHWPSSQVIWPKNGSEAAGDPAFDVNED